MPSQRILTISVLVAGVCGYYYLVGHHAALAIPMAVGILMAITAYVMQHQIDWWWFQRHPPRLPASIEALYQKVSPWYRSLSHLHRASFAARTTLYVKAKEFIGQGFETVAEDLKYMVAFYAILITWRQKKFLFKDYDRIVYYLHPFLSPHYPENVHACEVEHEDGTIILSIEQLAASFLSPNSYYQVGLHVMAETYQVKYPADELITYPDHIWDVLERMSGLSKTQIEDFTGLQLEDPWPVVVHHWHRYQSRFLEIAPALASEVKSIFEQSASSPERLD